MEKEIVKEQTLAIAASLMNGLSCSFNLAAL